MRVNIEDILSGFNFTWSIDKNENTSILVDSNNLKLNLLDVSVAWIRHFDLSTINFGENDLTKSFLFQQWDTAIESIQNSLSCEWVNTPYYIKRSFNRIRQLSVAKEKGLLIADTIVTNNPNNAREFYYSHCKDIVIKPLHHHRMEINGKVYMIYTHDVTTKDIENFDDLVYAPCILQERIHKKSEIRATVIEDKVYAAEILLQSRIEEDIDDIHRLNLTNLSKKSIVLDKVLEEKCIRIVKSLGLRYGAIDLIKSKDDILHFLEINAIGDWLWIERDTGLPITNSMVEMIERLANLSRYRASQL